MEIPYIFAQALGAFLVFLGAAALLRYKVYHRMVRHMTRRPRTILGIAIIELLIGLFIVVSHNVWQGPLWQVLVTVIGWLAVLEGLFYLFVPHGVVARIVRTCNTYAWYVVGGTLAIALGFYLAFSGFGLSLF